MKRLQDKISIITGGARGIDFSIDRKFAEKGSTVIIIDISKENIEKAVNKIKQDGLKASGYVTDVTDLKAVGALFKKIYKEFGSIDILINNAGITKDGLLLRMKEKDWDAVMTVNLKGTFVCTQKACRYMMKNKKSAIINISSVIGLMGNSGQANYAASKGGINALTKSTAKEFASRNIRVNAVAPGFIKTEMTEKLPEKVVEEYSKAIPLNRMGLPEDIANTCLFLASDEANYITGQVVQIDGGLLM